MNDQQLIDLVADTDAYAPPTPLPDSTWSRTDALHEIKRRIGMDTRDTTNREAAPSGATRQIEPSPNPERAERLTREKRKPGWSGALVAAGAFTAVIIVGVAILLVSRSGDEPEVPPADSVTLAPSEFAIDEALAVADAYFSAYETTDMDAMRALFAPDASISGMADLEEFFKETELMSAWNAAQGAVITELECVADQLDEAGVTVTCQYGDHQYIARAVGALPVPWTTVFRFDEDGKISTLSDRFGPPDYTAVNWRFDAWMTANHPADVSMTGCCAGTTVEESIARGTMRKTYAEEWVAYLEANGCTYGDSDC